MSKQFWSLSIFAVLVLLVGILLTQNYLKKQQPRYNIIFVLVDTLRADYLGSYGFDGKISPNIDKLAKASLRFTNVTAQAPWTKPSIASLFTGMHVRTHGMTDYQIKSLGNFKFKDFDFLADNAVTIAEALRDGGYKTAGFSGNHFVAPTFGLTQGFEHFKYEPTYRSYRDAQLLGDAKEWLSTYLKEEGQKKSSQPFFLYLQLMDVHGPYNFERQDFEELIKSKSLGEDQTLSAQQLPHQGIVKLPNWILEEQKLQLRTYRAAYAAGIKKFDRLFGNFMDFLKGNGLLENSIIIFTSDHGEELFEHGRWDHGYSLYENLLKVPLFIYHPAKEKMLGVNNEMLGLIDLFPTVLSLAGISKTYRQVQGKDFSPSLFQGEVELRSSLLSAGVRDKFRKDFLAYREEAYKIIFQAEKQESAELFNLVQDYNEQNDINAENPAIAAQLMEDALQYESELENNKNYKILSDNLDRESARKLQSLGYLK